MHINKTNAKKIVVKKPTYTLVTRYIHLLWRTCACFVKNSFVQKSFKIRLKFVAFVPETVCFNDVVYTTHRHMIKKNPMSYTSLKYAVSGSKARNFNQILNKEF